MTIEAAHDFLTESEVLHDAIAGLEAEAFQRPTQFKGWTIDDVLVHLHYWNRMADLSLTDEDAAHAALKRTFEGLGAGGLRPLENVEIAERGPALRDLWIGYAREMTPRWAEADPKRRLPWAGPSMSARSSITARQMETWAHGFEIFDMLGKTREETDRIRNIVILGVNTFGWTHQVHKLPLPEQMPELRLSAPSGAVWTFGEPGAGLIEGPAADFAAVVTQTRAYADTALTATPGAAETWMRHAQCFAGPPETPPAPGARARQGG